MAITTYSTLQTAVSNWLARDDISANRVQEFIGLFEAAANRRLRVRQMETSTNLTPSSGTATLPTDYLYWRRVTWTGTPLVELEYVQPTIFPNYYSDSASGTPQVFTIEGLSLKVRPIDDTTIQFAYYQKIPVLTENNTTNWLLTAHPDAYLFGALCEANAFTVNEPRAALWKARRDEVLSEIERLSNLSKGTGSIRVVGTVVV